MNCIYALLNK